ncbi:MAG TPA: DUF378 domain-containing protein [Thermomicrobiales bacterium]|nr:DUF378 domain-containing protein [Thermomicrobiales bacterium]
MKPLDLIALALVVVGALNWGLVGLFEFDLVATITGDEFGEVNMLSRIIYILVALAGIWTLTVMARLANTHEDTRTTSRA